MPLTLTGIGQDTGLQKLLMQPHMVHAAMGAVSPASLHRLQHQLFTAALGSARAAGGRSVGSNAGDLGA